MHLDPILLKLVIALLVILVVGLVSRVFKQPHVVGYLLAGVVLGPSGLGTFSDQESIARLGEFGVVFLLFFVGMEANPAKLVANWRVTLIGTLTQVGLSVGVIWVLGTALGWSTARIVLLGFVISLSSTAVVLNYLQTSGLMQSKLGQDTLGVLLAQDLAIIPMLIAVGILGGGSVDGHTLTLQGIGTVLAIALMVWLVKGKRVRLPLGERLRGDHELQVFLAVVLCLGFALITGLFELSTALGAFLAGMLVGVARETNWVHHRLDSFRVVFVALFFVSIGMLVDLDFLLGQWPLILGLVAATFVINTALNAVIFKMLGDPLRHAVMAGAVLAQIGEFSFVLAAVGEQTQLITQFAYQTTVAVIALSLLFSPAWIAGARLVLNQARKRRSGPVSG